MFKIQCDAEVVDCYEPSLVFSVAKSISNLKNKEVLVFQYDKYLGDKVAKMHLINTIKPHSL